MTERLQKRLVLPLAVPFYTWKTTVTHRANPLRVATLLATTLRRGFWPWEAHALGLLNPDTAKERLVHVVSKRAMVRRQRALNPREWEMIVADKAMLMGLFRAAGIPMPAMYGLFYHGGLGMTSAGRMISSVGEWERFFTEECPSPFVVKPMRGRHGLGVRLVQREARGLTDHTGTTLTAAGLVRDLEADRRFSGFVIQKRMHNHATIAGSLAGEGLATIRVISLLRSDGGVEIIHADFKMPLGGNHTSNLNLGAQGNVVAPVVPATGQLLGGVKPVPGRGTVPVEHHPETGVQIAGVRLPFWAEIRDLVLRAASAVKPVRTVGWDVIVTPEGPMILEGNIFYDPPNSTLHAGEVARLLDSA